MQRAIYGIVGEDSFELGTSPSITAHGRLTPTAEGTLIEIKFIKNYLLIAGFFRWKYERAIITDFLSQLFQPDHSPKYCNEDIFIVNKGAVPEKDRAEIRKKQDDICSAIASRLINDIPESWTSATLEITAPNGDLTCSIHSSGENCDVVEASAAIVDKANHLRDLFHDMKQFWKRAILTIQWDEEDDVWRFEVDYHY